MGYSCPPNFSLFYPRDSIHEASSKGTPQWTSQLGKWGELRMNERKVEKGIHINQLDG